MRGLLQREPLNFIRKETRINDLKSKDVKISVAVCTFRDNEEEKSRFPSNFWS